MLLTNISIRAFRNIERVDAGFCSRFNLFHGKNGQGKTNFLEAIFYLGTLKSFRHARQADMIGWNRQSAALACKVVNNNLRHDLSVSFESRGKQIKIDGKNAERLTEYCTILSVVAFSPDELVMVGGAPEQRRRYLDRAIFSGNPGYLKIYHDYFRVLKQRNQLLRERNYSSIEAWNHQLVETGSRLISVRNAYLSELAELFHEFYGIISGSDEQGRLCYHANSLECAAEPAEISKKLHQALQESMRSERERAATMVGPHRDDLGFMLDDKPIRQHGSQGQQKSFVLAMKMAEIEYLYRKNGTLPIFLLDDMAAELDNSRINHLLDYLLNREMQVFITTTDPAMVPLPEHIECSVFSVKTGQLEQ